jgi:hypothetical protein
MRIFAWASHAMRIFARASHAPRPCAVSRSVTRRAQLRSGPSIFAERRTPCAVALRAVKPVNFRVSVTRADFRVGVTRRAQLRSGPSIFAERRTPCAVARRPSIFAWHGRVPDITFFLRIYFSVTRQYEQNDSSDKTCGPRCKQPKIPMG